MVLPRQLLVENFHARLVKCRALNEDDTGAEKAWIARKLRHRYEIKIEEHGPRRRWMIEKRENYLTFCRAFRKLMIFLKKRMKALFNVA